MNARLFDLFKYFLQELPSLAAFAGCIVFAITPWKRLPKVAAVVTLALVFLLFHEVVFSFVYFYVPSYFLQNTRPEDVERVFRNVFLVIGLISNTLLAIGMILFLMGIFMRRKPGAAIEG